MFAKENAEMDVLFEVKIVWLLYEVKQELISSEIMLEKYVSQSIPLRRSIVGGLFNRQ